MFFWYWASKSELFSDFNCRISFQDRWYFSENNFFEWVRWCQDMKRTVWIFSFYPKILWTIQFYTDMMRRAVLQHAMQVEFWPDVPWAARATIWVIRQKIYMNHIFTSTKGWQNFELWTLSVLYIVGLAYVCTSL